MATGHYIKHLGYGGSNPKLKGQAAENGGESAHNGVPGRGYDGAALVWSPDKIHRDFSVI